MSNRKKLRKILSKNFEKSNDFKRRKKNVQKTKNVLYKKNQ